MLGDLRALESEEITLLVASGTVDPRDVEHLLGRRREAEDRVRRALLRLEGDETVTHVRPTP